MLRNVIATENGYPALDNRIILHIAHAHHAVNLLDPQPVQDVRHERLEAHVLDARDELRALEILVRAVAAALAQVVHEILGHLAQGTALLAEVRDDADAARLRAADALLDRIGEVWLARADIRPKDVRAVALVVHPDSELLRLVLEEGGITDW